MDGDGFRAVGTAFVPIVLTDAETSQKFRIVLYALVLPDMRLGMFIAQGSKFVEGCLDDGDGPVYTFNFGKGGIRNVDGT
jgi:hypothetical protein